MKFTSKTITANCTQQEAFEYITDLNNFENLLPTERLSDFKSTKDVCSFKAQGSFFVSLSVDKATEYEQVVFKTSDDSALKFTLEVNLKDMGDGTTEVSQVCNADLNPFLKMVIEKPLTKLFDYIADRMAEIHR